MNRSTLFAVKCCIPNCSNTSTNSRNKLFVHIRESIKKRWTQETNIKFTPGKRQYCCEDHLNLQEDLVSYLYWKTMNGRPTLKLTAKLRLSNTPTDVVAPILKTHLLKPLGDVDCCEYGATEHIGTGPGANDSENDMKDEIKTDFVPSPELLSAPSSTSDTLPSYCETDSSSILSLNDCTSELESNFVEGKSDFSARKHSLHDELMTPKENLSTVDQVPDSVSSSTTSTTPENRTSTEQTQPVKSGLDVPVCRACLAHNTRMFTIVDTPLQKIFEKITGIQLRPSDGKPTRVCYVCHNLLKKCHKFAENALKSQEVLQNMYKTSRIKIDGRSFVIIDTTVLSKHYTSQLSTVCSDVEEIDIPPSEHAQNTTNEQIFITERSPIQQTSPVAISLPFIPFNPGTVAVGSSLLLPEITRSNPSMVTPVVKEKTGLVTDRKLPRLKPATPYNFLVPPPTSTVLAPSSLSHIITPIMINKVVALPSLNVADRNVCENQNKDVNITKNVTENEKSTENTGENEDCTSENVGIKDNQIKNKLKDKVVFEDDIDSGSIEIKDESTLVKEEPGGESQLIVDKPALLESTSENVDNLTVEIKTEDDVHFMMDDVVIKDDETSWRMLEEELDYEVKEEIIEIDETQLQGNSDSHEPAMKKAKTHDISISDNP